MEALVDPRIVTDVTGPVNYLDMGAEDDAWSHGVTVAYTPEDSTAGMVGHQPGMDELGKALAAVMEDGHRDVVEVASTLTLSRYSMDSRLAAGLVLESAPSGASATPAEAFFHPWARPSRRGMEMPQKLAEAAGDDEAWAEALAELDAQPSGETPEEFIFLGWTDVSPQVPDDFGFAWSDGSTPRTGRYSGGMLQLDQ